MPPLAHIFQPNICSSWYTFSASRIHVCLLALLAPMSITTLTSMQRYLPLKTLNRLLCHKFTSLAKESASMAYTHILWQHARLSRHIFVSWYKLIFYGTIRLLGKKYAFHGTYLLFKSQIHCLRRIYAFYDTLVFHDKYLSFMAQIRP